MYALFTSTLIPGNGDVLLMGRARSETGSLLNAVTVASIAWTLTDVGVIGGPTVLGTGTFSVASSILSACAVDSFWLDALQGKDLVGYNFRAILPAANLPVASSGHRVVIDLKITMVSGEVLRAQFHFPTLQVYG